MLSAGVPLNSIPTPKLDEENATFLYENVGWLTVAADQPETLRLLLAAGASKNDQRDKDLALSNASRSGKLNAVKLH